MDREKMERERGESRVERGLGLETERDVDGREVREG